MSEATVVAGEVARRAQELRGIGREVWALLLRLVHTSKLSGYHGTVPWSST